MKWAQNPYKDKELTLYGAVKPRIQVIDYYSIGISD